MRTPLIAVLILALPAAPAAQAPSDPAGTWHEPIAAGLDGWRQPAAWTLAGAVRPDPTDRRRLVTTAGRGILCNGNRRTSNILTREEFGDIEARIEFLVPQGSNSGVYFQGRYEVQILDSFGKAKPGFGDCGGIYQRWQAGKGFDGHPPRSNASRRPGEWQEFRVLFRAPRFDDRGRKTANARFVRVEHNGVVIHEDVELTGPTRAASFGDERATGPLMLQGDHGPVAFRNIRIRRLPPAPVDSRFWVPTAAHRRETIAGFPVLVDPRLHAEAELYQATMRELRSQLYQITRKVPAAALARLRQVDIYVERRSNTRCMAYHPSRRWLAGNGYNPEMAKSVELGNPQTFLAWTKAQPWMVLHELAHAYHHQFLAGGFGNPEVKACYDAARAAGTYESVQHIQGQKVRAYALTNPMEYFAETSEAYFGTNDMYPFVRSELQAHDPKAYALLRKLWGQ